MSVTVEGPAQFIRTESGWISRAGSAVMFFGDKTSSVEGVKRLLPDVRFSFLKQVHSDRMIAVEAPQDPLPEADAQMTRAKNVALGIHTADCLPVLITDGKYIAAVHAGWRGLEASICEKAVRHLRSLGANPDMLKAAIGPHIAQESFEVGRDISERLLAVYRKLAYNPHPLGVPHPTDPAKRMVDLAVLAQAQLIHSGVPEKMITVLRTDTLKDQDFHSYRRNKDAPGRQISFIVVR